MSEWSSLDAWWQDVGEPELRLILWSAWDPIGRVPRDEYDWYVPRLWALLQEHASVLHEAALRGEAQIMDAELEEWTDRAIASENRIAAQLSEWRTERIGIPADPDSDRVVAMKLTDWLDPPGMPDLRPIDLVR